MVVCYYVCDCIPKPEDNTEHRGLDQIDQGFLDYVWKWKTRRPRLPENRNDALEVGVLLFSDIQIVTSLAILSAGYSQLHCGISSYDWQILVYPAWFSSVTHLTTLTVIWHWFRRKSRKSLVIRALRVFLMFCTIIMLIIALLPTGNQNWLWDPSGNSTGGVPAICFFSISGTVQVIALHTNKLTRWLSQLLSSGSVISQGLSNSSPSRPVRQERSWEHDQESTSWKGQSSGRATQDGYSLYTIFSRFNSLFFVRFLISPNLCCEKWVLLPWPW
jgi:hypothetical protein